MVCQRKNERFSVGDLVQVKTYRFLKEPCVVTDVITTATEKTTYLVAFPNQLISLPVDAALVEAWVDPRKPGEVAPVKLTFDEPDKDYGTQRSKEFDGRFWILRKHDDTTVFQGHDGNTGEYGPFGSHELAAAWCGRKAANLLRNTQLDHLERVFEKPAHAEPSANGDSIHAPTPESPRVESELIPTGVDVI